MGVEGPRSHFEGVRAGADCASDELKQTREIGGPLLVGHAAAVREVQLRAVELLSGCAVAVREAQLPPGL